MGLSVEAEVVGAHRAARLDFAPERELDSALEQVEGELWDGVYRKVGLKGLLSAGG